MHLKLDLVPKWVQDMSAKQKLANLFKMAPKLHQHEAVIAPKWLPNGGRNPSEAPGSGMM